MTNDEAEKLAKEAEDKLIRTRAMLKTYIRDRERENKPLKRRRNARATRRYH